MTPRVDFALFMVPALENDKLIHAAPAIVGCRTPSALALATQARRESGSSRPSATPNPFLKPLHGQAPQIT